MSVKPIAAMYLIALAVGLFMEYIFSASYGLIGMSFVFWGAVLIASED